MASLLVEVFQLRGVLLADRELVGGQSVCMEELVSRNGTGRSGRLGYLFNSFQSNLKQHRRAFLAITLNT